MRRNKGFTLIELMVVILIVAILAAVLAPMLSGRVRSAKWTEGKAGAGTIATALRGYLAEHDGVGTVGAGITGGSGAFNVIGITNEDLLGKYFNEACYSVTGIAYDPLATTPVPIAYTIIVNTASANVGSGAPSGTRQLRQDGKWSEDGGATWQ